MKAELAAQAARGKNAGHGNAHALAEDSFRAHVQQHLPRNARAYLVHGMLGMTGFRLVTATTSLEPDSR